MRARELAGGKLLVPRRAESDGVIGDAMVEIGPDDPEYAAWRAELDELIAAMLAVAPDAEALDRLADMEEDEEQEDDDEPEGD